MRCVLIYVLMTTMASAQTSRPVLQVKPGETIRYLVEKRSIDTQTTWNVELAVASVDERVTFDAFLSRIRHAYKPRFWEAEPIYLDTTAEPDDPVDAGSTRRLRRLLGRIATIRVDRETGALETLRAADHVSATAKLGPLIKAAPEPGLWKSLFFDFSTADRWQSERDVDGIFMAECEHTLRASEWAPRRVIHRRHVEMSADDVLAAIEERDFDRAARLEKDFVGHYSFEARTVFSTDDGLPLTHAEKSALHLKLKDRTIESSKAWSCHRLDSPGSAAAAPTPSDRTPLVVRIKSSEMTELGLKPVFRIGESPARPLWEVMGVLQDTGRHSKWRSRSDPKAILARRDPRR